MAWSGPGVAPTSPEQICSTGRHLLMGLIVRRRLIDLYDDALTARDGSVFDADGGSKFNAGSQGLPFGLSNTLAGP